MTKVVYLPLDERPCNAQFPNQIARFTDLAFVSPPLSILGKKKQAGPHDRLSDWLRKETALADYLVVSLDMLVYGGIVPSRLHYLSLEECRKRLTLLIELKQMNPKLRIYAFNLIMRAPAYNSSEEEPDYYAYHGYNLFTYGWLTDKKNREQLTEEESVEWERVKTDLPRKVLNDFLSRRNVNSAVNQLAIDHVQRDVINFLIIPLDDNAEYGYTSQEQRNLLFSVEDNNLSDRIHIYPGADEIGCSMFARVFCEVKRYRPEVFVRFSSTLGPTIIPKYEDRSLGESVKYHLTAAGAFIGDSSASADVVLMVNSAAVGHDMTETSQSFRERHRSYFSEINYQEFATAIKAYADKGKMIALADVSTCNGADTALMQLLSKSKLLGCITAYAAWNTSGNALGTVIAHAIVESYYRRDNRSDMKSPEQTVQQEVSAEDCAGAERAAAERNRHHSSIEFYLYRLIEDWGYQSLVREDIVLHDLPNLGGEYFRIAHIRNQVYTLIKAKLEEFIDTHLRGLYPMQFRISNIYLPWDRMFEICFELSLDGSAVVV